jgi:hypothetical protein
MNCVKYVWIVSITFMYLMSSSEARVRREKQTKLQTEDSKEKISQIQNQQPNYDDYPTDYEYIGEYDDRSKFL